MRYPTSKEIELIERKRKVKYPPSFKNSLTKLPDIYEEVKAIYPHAEFISTISQFDHGKYLGVTPKNDLIPFFLVHQTDFIDYHCFKHSSANSEYKVVVFAGDAIVFEWTNFDAWVCWSKKKALDI